MSSQHSPITRPQSLKDPSTFLRAMPSPTLLDEQLYLRFRDRKPEMALAWVQHFSDGGRWSYGVGDLLRERGDACVSPANSYGQMDGGIDLAYRNLFGLRIQRRVQDIINQRFHGEMPIGEAFVVPTGNARIPRMIVAPTMKYPHDISTTENVYTAMKAVLERALVYNYHQHAQGKEVLHTLLVPGMGTGIGRMDPLESARQMRKAVDAVRDELADHNNTLDYLVEKNATR